MIAGDVSLTVGRTPLVELRRLARGLPGRVVAKLEMRNPCGSVKDRLGVALIEDAERRGILRSGMTIVEATGGNTGIGLAFAATIRGYRLVLAMPKSMSGERVRAAPPPRRGGRAHPGHPHGQRRCAGRPACPRDPQRAHPRPVPQPGEPRDPPADHRRGGLVRHGRSRRCVRVRGGYGGHDHGSRRSPQGAQAGGPRRRRGAGRGGGPLRRVGGEPPHAGHRRRFHPRRPEPGHPRRGHRRDRRRGIRLSAGWHARRASSRTFRPARRYTRALAVASRGEAAGEMVVVLLADTGERYLATELFAREKPV